MKKNFISRGFTLIELLTAVVLIGILASIMIGRFLVAKDRAHVTAAQSDVDHFRKALSVYSVDYGLFPDAIYNDPTSLSQDLVDPVGNPYMVTPDGRNFGTFTYSPVDAGEQYEIQVEALDHAHTVIVASADGIAVQ
jgi:prepilin-type N-terminal cleavage/methylation domain-containing protein